MDWEERIRSINWCHGFQLGGIHTRGPKASAIMLARADRVFKYPVAGKTVLDIGAWDGFFSFGAERRGAAQVLATDRFCWSGPGWGTKAGFDLATEVLESRVESRDIDTAELTPEKVGPWDVVLSLGVLYHVADPIGHIRRVRHLAREMAILETLIDTARSREARFLLIKSNQRGGDSADDTNYLAPNLPAVYTLLKWAGFSRVEHEVDRKLRRGLFHAFV